MKKTLCQIIIVIILVLSIFVSWFCILRHEPKSVSVEHNSYLVLNDSSAIDSVKDSVFNFMLKADRMEKEIEKLQDNYQSEVDLMIDKANGWMAFWIGVLALVIGLMSIWQIYRQKNSENEFHLLEENMKKTYLRNYKEARQRINKTIDDTISGLKGEISLLEKKMQNTQQTLRESRLGALMMCLSSFPDPQMVADSSDKKRQMHVVLKHVSNTYHDYVNEFCKDINNKSYNTENTYLVLTVVKLAVVRTHGIYSDIHQNIMIQKLLDYVAETNKMILDGNVADQLPERIKKIDIKLRDLLRVIES